MRFLSEMEEGPTPMNMKRHEGIGKQLACEIDFLCPFHGKQLIMVVLLSISTLMSIEINETKDSSIITYMPFYFRPLPVLWVCFFSFSFTFFFFNFRLREQSCIKKILLLKKIY